MRSISCARSLRAIVVGISVLAFGLVFSGSALADESDDVENFAFSSWDLHYELSLDDQGRAQAEVTEELVAQFPDTDQNRGIVRSLPLRYQGAPAEPQHISVTDGAGNAVPFETENSEGFLTILVGDDSFVHGSQTYVISYTVEDVMHATDEADEFYWDIVPVDRQQPIDDVTAEIEVDPALSSALTGSSACYRGNPDDTQACNLETTGDESSTFTIAEQDLPTGQGLTAAIGVEPGTVTQPPQREDNFLLDAVPLVLVGASLLLSAGGAVAAMRMVRRHRNDTSQTSTQYGIPEGMTPMLAKWLTGRGADPIVATILDLAVHGVLRIEENESEGKKSKPEPVLRLLDPELATDPLETQLLEGIFPGLAPGATFAFPKNSKTFTKAAQGVEQESGKAVLERGYQQKVRHRGAALTGWLSFLPLLPAVVLLIMGASRDNTVMTVLSIVLGVLSLMLALICVLQHRVLTPAGAAARRQLERVRELMKASESDRLEMMQSFTHASRRSATEDEAPNAQILELYDQLLPYAVLFGLQKDWSKVLASTYEHYHLPAPIWYPMLLQHGTNNMSDHLSSMLSSVSSAAATSSPNAGSTGGGAAGGGGGGGAAGGR